MLAERCIERRNVWLTAFTHALTLRALAFGRRFRWRSLAHGPIRLEQNPSNYRRL
jgi:hypothetical protein